MSESVLVNPRRVKSSETQVSPVTGRRYVRLFRPYIDGTTRGWVLFRTDEAG
jgi:hypothetical protein